MEGNCLKKNILGVTLARGGSKGIKNKNIVNILGKPLISYTIILHSIVYYTVVLEISHL